MAPDALPDPLRVALDVASTFERLGVPYVAVGSLASSFHGAPRSTNDVDFLAGLTGPSVEHLAKDLAPHYYVSREAMNEAVAVSRGGSFNAIHIGTAVKVDVFVAGDDPFDVERLRTRRLASIGGGVLCIDTAEHTILRKLEWFRRGGEVSERQWSDVLGIVRAQGERMDRAYLRSWADRLRVRDLLERALGSPA
jgi:hypothetical protein